MSYKFIQMSDPQLGFYASRHPGVTGIDYEIEHLSKAVSLTNKINPDFCHYYWRLNSRQIRFRAS